MEQYNIDTAVAETSLWSSESSPHSYE